MFAALALAGALIGQNSGVTFSSPGLPLPKLLEGLSQAAHTRLYARPAFDRDIVAVRFKDVPLQEVLKRISAQVEGDWEAKDGGYELVVSARKLADEEARELAAQEKVIRDALDEEAKRAAKLDAWDEGSARALANAIDEIQKANPLGNGNVNQGVIERLQTLERGTPGGRAMSRLASRLNVHEIALLPMDIKVVFSDKPTKLQRPMPAGVMAALSQLASEQNSWAEVAAAYEPPQSGYISTSLYSKTRLDRQGKTLLTVYKQAMYGNLSISLQLLAADAKGRYVIQTSKNISTWDNSLSRPPTAKTDEQPVDLSPEAAAICDAFSSLRGGGQPKPVSKEVRILLASPNKLEPLSLLPGQALVAIAERRGLNLMATLPDGSFLGTAAISGQMRPTPSLLMTGLRAMGADPIEQDGWMLIAPKAPLTARRVRADRTMAAKFLQAIARIGRADLDTMAEYAGSLDQGRLYDSIAFPLSLVIGGAPPAMGFDPLLLSFYGRLTPMQRASLTSGGVLLSTLTDRQWEPLNKMVFGENYGLSSQPARTQEEADLMNGLRREPTEIFKDGIPRESVVTARDSWDDTISASSATPGGRYSSRAPMTASMVAQTLLARERPGIMPWMEVDPNWDALKFSLTRRRTLNLIFDFGGIAGLDRQLIDDIPAGDEPVPYSQLPEKFRKEVDQRLEQMRRVYKDVKPGQFGGPGPTRVPPPAR